MNCEQASHNQQNNAFFLYFRQASSTNFVIKHLVSGRLAWVLDRGVGGQRNIFAQEESLLLPSKRKIFFPSPSPNENCSHRGLSCLKNVVFKIHYRLLLLAVRTTQATVLM